MKGSRGSVGVGEDAENDLPDQTQRRRDVECMQQVLQSRQTPDATPNVGSDQESEWKVDGGHPFLGSRFPIVMVAGMG